MTLFNQCNRCLCKLEGAAGFADRNGSLSSTENTLSLKSQDIFLSRPAVEVDSILDFDFACFNYGFVRHSLCCPANSTTGNLPVTCFKIIPDSWITKLTFLIGSQGKDGFISVLGCGAVCPVVDAFQRRDQRWQLGEKLIENQRN